MGIANCIGGRGSGVSRRSNRRRVIRPAHTTVFPNLEKLEPRQVLSALTVSVPGTADPYLASPTKSRVFGAALDGKTQTRKRHEELSPPGDRDS
jgi:hypothetical protein